MNNNKIRESWVSISSTGWNDFSFYTVSGLMVAIGYERIVYGCRGTYIEFTDKQILKQKIKVPQESEWRFQHPSCCYIEFRTCDASFVKVYYQLKIVSYADYKIGMYYIALIDLWGENGKNLYIQRKVTCP